MHKMVLLQMVPHNRIRIFGIACPSDFFVQIKRVEIALMVCHNQESAQNGICTIWISLPQMKNNRNAMNHESVKSVKSF